MKPTKNASKSIQVRVPGRGIHMNASTRVVPHRHLDRKRPTTKAILAAWG